MKVTSGMWHALGGSWVFSQHQTGTRTKKVQIYVRWREKKHGSMCMLLDNKFEEFD